MVTALDEDTVRGALSGLEMSFYGLNEDDVTEEQSHQLFDNLHDLMRGLCAGHVFNGEPYVVDSPVRVGRWMYSIDK